MKEQFEYLLKIFKKVSDNEYQYCGLAFSNKVANGYEIIETDISSLPSIMPNESQIDEFNQTIKLSPTDDFVFIAEEKDFLDIWGLLLGITLEEYIDMADNKYRGLHLVKDIDDNFKFKWIPLKRNTSIFDFGGLFSEMLSSTLNKDYQTKVYEERDFFNDYNSLDARKEIDVNRIITEMKRKFIAQEDVIDSIVLNIYANQRLIDTKDKDLISTSKSSILLDGPTGTGKTAIIKEVADRLGLPVVITKSTAYSTTGYVGSDLSDILQKLLQKANGNLELAQRGIVCMDEFDKLGGGDKDNSLIMKEAVQEDLLIFIGGSTYDISPNGNIFSPQKQEFDTTNLTFIGMGAFTDLLESKKKEVSKTTMGIVSNTAKEETKNTYVVENKDYIEYGLIRELVGRLTLKTHTKAYMKEDYKKILLNSDISPLKMFEKTVRALGVEFVSADSDFIDEAASLAYDMGSGVRGLQEIFSDIKNYYLNDIINNNCKEIYLTVETLNLVKEKKIRKF